LLLIIEHWSGWESNIYYTLNKIFLSDEFLDPQEKNFFWLSCHKISDSPSPPPITQCNVHLSLLAHLENDVENDNSWYYVWCRDLWASLHVMIERMASGGNRTHVLTWELSRFLVYSLNTRPQRCYSLTGRFVYIWLDTSDSTLFRHYISSCSQITWRKLRRGFCDSPNTRNYFLWKTCDKGRKCHFLCDVVYERPLNEWHLEKVSCW